MSLMKIRSRFDPATPWGPGCEEASPTRLLHPTPCRLSGDPSTISERLEDVLREALPLDSQTIFSDGPIKTITVGAATNLVLKIVDLARLTLGASTNLPVFRF
jgi:hypothetical protein